MQVQVSSCIKYHIVLNKILKNSYLSHYIVSFVIGETFFFKHKGNKGLSFTGFVYLFAFSEGTTIFWEK